MLLKKIFYRELVNNATKIFIVLVLVLPITELFKKLEEAASGSIPVSTLFALMLYGTIASFPIILTIACFLSIALTVNRYCKDQEFVIWLASGVPAFYWVRLTCFFAIPMTIICAICSMFIMPWATLKSQEYINFLSKQQTTMLISPGIFKESNDNQVFYLDHYSFSNGYAKNIFVQYNSTNNTLYNIVAKSGTIVSEDGLVSLILKNGHRYELTNASDTILQLGFGQFKASVKQNYVPLDKTKVNIPTSSMQTLVTEGSNHAKAELSWRLSIPIMMFIMSIFVVPISIQIGRVQSSLVFILPPIVYSIYENIILTINGYISDGKINSLIGIFLVHSVMLGFAIFLTYLKTFPKGYLKLRNKKEK